ncbi:hypothetical protein NM688_g4571 [Phlebia brevispora]|uniref:Uncharacterized protein n=1 Tax=Phlebia brevispora TaxID=194682 RepID=A0ACC1T2P9_9APHY|nr:hypothetical protein NM688_g4571 [Phlebia brevispora]
MMSLGGLDDDTQVVMPDFAHENVGALSMWSNAPAGFEWDDWGMYINNFQNAGGMTEQQNPAPLGGRIHRGPTESIICKPYAWESNVLSTFAPRECNSLSLHPQSAMRPIATLIRILHIPGAGRGKEDEHRNQAPIHASPRQAQSSGKLVPEIVDMVIDQLEGDKASLAACTLVARGWYNRSRYHLFHTVTIKTTSRLKGFLIFLAKSTVREHVRVLRLGNQNGSEKTKFKLGPASFASILTSLPALTTLGVYHASWDPNQKDKFVLPKEWTYKPHAIDAFELVEVVNVRRKGMIGGTPLSLDDVRACLQHFSSVGNLTITHAKWRDDESTTLPEPALQTEPLAGLRVAKLSVLSHAMLPSILQLLPMTSSAHTLRTLLVGMSEWEGVVALGELLAQGFGGHIEELSIVFACVCRFLSVEVLWRTMNLGCCTELRSLCYWVFMFSNNPRSNRLYWDAISALLTEAPNKLRKLEHIKFNICMSGEIKLLAHQIEGVDWKQLEELLSRLPSLRTVEIVLEHRGGSVVCKEAAWKTITEGLPTLASKGRGAITVLCRDSLSTSSGYHYLFV